MNLHLTERQSRTIASALTTLAAAVLVLTVVLLAWLAAAFLDAFSSVFLPLAVGAISALVADPYYTWLRRRARLPSTVAVAVVFLTILLPMAGFLAFFGQLLLTQLFGLLAHVPEWWREGESWVLERWPAVRTVLQDNGWLERLRAAAAAQQDAILAGLQDVGGGLFAVGRGIMRGAGALLGWAVVPVYFAFFLTIGNRKIDTDQLLPFLKPATRQDVVYLAGEFLGILVAFFRGQMLVALLQGLMYAIGFSLVGLSYGFVLGLLLGLLNVVPYLGSMVGLGLTVPIALLQNDGGPLLLALALTVFVVVQAIEGWVLTPKIMGDRTGLHFMTIIVAIFFWGTALNGILGMILAIPLTAFLASLWRLARAKYIPELF